MKKSQWESVLKTARGEVTGGLDRVHRRQSVDPGFRRELSTVDYIADPDVWLQANLAVRTRSPRRSSCRGFWVEPGMAAEPSGFGCRIVFSDDQPRRSIPSPEAWKSWRHWRRRIHAGTA